MKKIFTMFFIVNCCAVSLYADSFLTAQQFPKTFEDLSFTSRIEVLREGYMPFEVEYDDDGVCIRGCAYRGLTIKEDMAAVDEANEEIAQIIAEEESKPTAGTPSYSDTTTTQPIAPSYPDTPTPVAPSYPDTNTIQTDWCRNGKTTNLPLRYPVDMTNLRYLITSDFGFRNVKKGSKFHPAIDIGVPVGTSVYATADGVVDNVFYDENGGGNVISIKHDRGLITQYLHLSQTLVKKGEKVSACQKIALSGNTGVSTGPHLDYRVRFQSDKNKYVDIFCPSKASNRNSQQSYGINIVNDADKHSLFYNTYKFKNQSAKHSKWRADHGHCMYNVNDLLPDEVL